MSTPSDISSLLNRVASGNYTDADLIVLQRAIDAGRIKIKDDSINSTTISGQGAHIRGDVETSGGDMVGRDKYYGLQGDDISRIIDTLYKHIAQQYLSPDHLDSALKDFRLYIQQLAEWKRVHDYLNDILITSDVFSNAVRRSVTARILAKNEIVSSWKEVQRRVDYFRDWAKRIKYIGQPYREENDGTIRGEPWIVLLVQKAQNIQDDLTGNRLPTSSLKMLSIELKDLALDYLYLADKNLLEIASSIERVAHNLFRDMQ